RSRSTCARYTTASAQRAPGSWPRGRSGPAAAAATARGALADVIVASRPRGVPRAEPSWCSWCLHIYAASMPQDGRELVSGVRHQLTGRWGEGKAAGGPPLTSPSFQIAGLRHDARDLVLRVLQRRIDRRATGEGTGKVLR